VDAVVGKRLDFRQVTVKWKAKWCVSRRFCKS
jgi:hypothetical protein